MDSSNDTKLGELLGRYQRLRSVDPHAPLADLEAEAGDLYPELRELVACLDVMIGESSDLLLAQEVTASHASGRNDRRGARRRPGRGLLFGLVVALALGGWLARSAWVRQPTLLSIKAYPSATLTLDGRPLEASAAPGQYVLRATRAGFESIEVSLEIVAGAAFAYDVWLLPSDPFEADTMAAFGEAHGVQFLEPAASLPRPTAAENDVDSSSFDPSILDETAFDLEAVRLEAARLPPALRASEAGRYLRAERLYRLGWYRPSLRIARELVKAHPNRKEPLRLALHALWGLALVESPPYRTLYQRYRSTN